MSWSLCLFGLGAFLTWMAVKNHRLNAAVCRRYLAHYDSACPSGRPHAQPRIFTQARQRIWVGWTVYYVLLGVLGYLVVAFQ